MGKNLEVDSYIVISHLLVNISRQASNLRIEMKVESNLSTFAYIENIRKVSKDKLINLGILVNSGGVIGIITLSKDKPEGLLKTAMLFFIMSLANIFLSELATMKFANDSIKQLFRIDDKNTEAKLKDLILFNRWWSGLIRLIDFSAFGMGIYAVKKCFDYLNLPTT